MIKNNKNKETESECESDNNKDNVLFCHIPKTAGQSINFMLTCNNNINYKYLMHIPLRSCINDFRNYYKFAVVRDPVYRCISGFYYIRRLKINNIKNKIKRIEFFINNIENNNDNFKSLKNIQKIKENANKQIENKNKLLNNLENSSIINKNQNENKKRNIHKKFLLFIYQKKIKRMKRINELLDGDIKVYLENFEEFYNLIFYNVNINKLKFSKKKQSDNCMWLPQYIYIYDKDDNLLVDKILNINEFYEYLCNCKYIINNNITHNNNTNDRINYDDLITDKFKETIYKIYEKDYKLLNKYF